jgi:hypothetical protein
MGSCHTSGATAALALVLFLLMAAAGVRELQKNVLEHTSSNTPSENQNWRYAVSSHSGFGI